MRAQFVRLITCMALLGLSPAMATTTTYQIPDGYPWSGSITTDGKLGVLGSQDITAWDLTIVGVVLQSRELGSSFALFGGDLSASASGWLYFDVSDPNTPPGYLKFSLVGASVTAPSFFAEFEPNGMCGEYCEQLGQPPGVTGHYAGLFEYGSLGPGSTVSSPEYFFPGGEFSPSVYWPLAYAPPPPPPPPPLPPAATPLPAALPLFATGLGALGLFGWRRKRKNGAATAAA